MMLPSYRGRSGRRRCSSRPPDRWRKPVTLTMVRFPMDHLHDVHGEGHRLVVVVMRCSPRRPRTMMPAGKASSGHVEEA